MGMAIMKTPQLDAVLNTTHAMTKDNTDGNICLLMMGATESMTYWVMPSKSLNV